MNDTLPFATEKREMFGTIASLLVCPDCHRDLTVSDNSLTCGSCKHSYEVSDGVPLLARTGSSEQWGCESDGATSVDYQVEFQKADIGPRYQQCYKDRWSKRRVTRREIRCIRKLLAAQPRSQRMLDIPCGGGRVSGPLANATDLLLQADISLGQVQTARQVMSSQQSIAWFTASAFLIPMKDGAVDAILCNRLSHHLPAVEREQLIRELLRVASQFVILSYYDHDSFKSLGRRLRGRDPGHTLRRKDLHALAEQNGAFVQTDVPLWYLGSRLRYAVLQKRAA